LNDVIRYDKEFFPAKVTELQGDILLKQNETKNLDKAINLYKKSQVIDPSNFFLLLKLARCLDRKRTYAESSEFYKQALKIDPTSANVTFRLGWALFRLG